MRYILQGKILLSKFAERIYENMFKRSIDFGRGIYGVGDTLFPFGFFRNIRYSFYRFCHIGYMLFFNVKFKFIDYILNKHETLSYYLCSFGWVPYFIAVMFLLLVCTHVIFGYEQELFGKSVLTLGIFAVAGFLISPIVAFFKKKCRK